MNASGVPALRVRALVDRPADPRGSYVLYWMTAHRRARSNFALERAAELCRSLGRGLLVLEGLRCAYPWASDRLHRFVIEGMADNAADFERRGVRYLPYVEPEPGAGQGLLEALSRRACAVVTDEFPCFFLPRMLGAAKRLAVRVEVVDGNGLLPLAATDRVFHRAWSLRRHLQASLAPHLGAFPRADPLRRLPPAPALPAEVGRRWPAAKVGQLLAGNGLAALPIDHGVAPAPARGGARAAEGVLRRFVGERLARYASARNQPDDEVASGLSPYLHFGHVSAHQVVGSVLEAEGWTPQRLGRVANGAREGFWGVSPDAEAFLDQVCTWRELGYHFCARVPGYDRWESLPAWSRATLELHAADPRPHLYTPDQLEQAATHDAIWNAAQTQLREEGRIHNYLRMLWGKKVLEWSRHPREALATLIHLNNKYALDGRNPNSYSGIFWTFGRFDRPWGPERPVFGAVRTMTSASTARKLKLRGYLARWSPARQERLF